MPAAKKTAARRPRKPSVDVDIDALLKEAGFKEPDRVSLRWRGRDWSLVPVSAVDPRLLAEIASVDGVIAALEEALGPEQAAEFPMPRAVELPDGNTELGVFLDAWADASGESASSGE